MYSISKNVAFLVLIPSTLKHINKPPVRFMQYLRLKLVQLLLNSVNLAV